MINTSEFSKRLQKVIDYYNESASSFAQKIDVQRSSISHILSGRNKPSLDFVLKILDAYPEVELYWLLNGKGHFPKMEESKIPSTPKIESTEKKSQNLFSENENQKNTKEDISNFENKPLTSQNLNNKNIERIVIFYSDGTFSNFTNS
jgi:transcriptional regulator with XRE-family HTH domain